MTITHSLAHRFISSYTWLVFSQITMVLTGIISSIMLTRWLGPDQYGLLATILSFSALLLMSIEFGYANIIQVYIPTYSQNESAKGKTRLLLNRLMFNRIFITAIICSAVIYFSHNIANVFGKPELTNYLKYSTVFIFTTHVIAIPSSFFNAQLRLKIVSVIQVARQIFFIATLIIFSQSLFLNEVIGIHTILNIVQLIILCVLMYRAIPSSQASDSKLELKSIYTFGIIAWSSSIWGLLLSKDLSVLILNFYHIDAREVGYFNLACVIGVYSSILSMGLGSIVQSAMAEGYAKDGIKKIGQIWQFALKLTIFVTFPIVMFMYFNAEKIIALLFSKNYLGSVGILKVLLVSRLLYDFLGASFTVPALYILNKQKAVLLLNMASGISALILNFLLIPIMGSIGAILGTWIPMTFIAFVYSYYSFKKLSVLPPIFFIIKLTLACTIAIIVSNFINNDSQILDLIIKGSLFSVIFLIVIVSVKIISADERLYIENNYPFTKQFMKIFST